MGILNVTPDSFFDGGAHDTLSTAILKATQLEQAGAQYIDIGGESSRPGAEPVSLDEERRRVIPVVRELVERMPTVTLSIDTVKPQIAEEALSLGAHVINDIRGLRDADMIDVAARSACGVVLMHMRGAPLTMQSGDLSSEDIVEEIKRWLSDRIEACLAAGIAAESIMIDPGIGFGKTVAQNLELIDRLHELIELGYPLLFGASRKSFIGALTGAPPSDRLYGSIAANVIATVRGARVLRVHDVHEMSAALKVTEGILATGALAGDDLRSSEIGGLWL
jgi:dihydropteroate synthase